VLTAAGFAERSGERMKTTDFPTFTLERRSGHIACETYSGVPVCQLSAPGVLRVRQGGRDWHFESGVGQRVTLIVEKSAPRCVIAAQQSAADWNRENLIQTYRPGQRD